MWFSSGLDDDGGGHDYDGGDHDDDDDGDGHRDDYGYTHDYGVSPGGWCSCCIFWMLVVVKGIKGGGWVAMTMTMEVIMMVNGDYNDGGNTYGVVSEDYGVGSNDVSLRDDVCDVRRFVVVKLIIFVDGDDIGDKDAGRNCCGGDDIGDKDTVLG